MKPKPWAVGVEDVWNNTFDTLEDAIEFGVADYMVAEAGCVSEIFDDVPDDEMGDVCFEIGSTEEFVPHVDTGCVIDRIADDAYEFIPDYADDYLSDIIDDDFKVLDEALNKAFRDWMNDRGYAPTFYRIHPIVRVNPRTGEMIPDDNQKDDIPKCDMCGKPRFGRAIGYKGMDICAICADGVMRDMGAEPQGEVES